MRGHLTKFVFFKFVFFWSLVGANFFVSSNVFAGSACKTLLTGILESKAVDWEHRDRSLSAVALNSVIWLSGAEAAQSFFGSHQSFGSAFAANTSIDIVLTMMSHQISLGRVPAKFKSLFEGKQNYKRRALLNTTMAMSVLLPIWAITAAATGAPVTDLEGWLNGEVIKPLGVLGALGLLYSAYRIAPHIKSYFFQHIPQRRDHQRWLQLWEKFPDEMRVIESAAKNRADNFELSQAEFENLVLSMMEVVRLRIPFEEKISAPLANVNRVKKSISAIEAEDREPQKASLRLALTKSLLHLHDKGLHRSAVESVLSLGEPFDHSSSLELHRELNQRHQRKQLRLAVTGFVDQSIWVGFMGGVALRALTGYSLPQ
jgi:hypothetical protein